MIVIINGLASLKSVTPLTIDDHSELKFFRYDAS